MTETIPQARTAGDADITKPGATSGGLLVLAPLRFEARAVRRGLREASGRVQRTGMGATRAIKAAKESKHDTFGTLIVMGTAAGLSDDLSPGDLVVGAEVSDGFTTVLLPGADLLAAELRRAGFSARAGKIATVP